jgi:hypothetical protein
MLREYVLTPDIFDASCYSNQKICRPLFKNILDPLLQEGIVRNLRDGEWIDYVNDETFSLYPMAKYFLEQLILKKRLRRFPKTSENAPQNYRDWCGEALKTNDEDLDGIIVSEEIYKDKKFKNQGKIGSIEQLHLRSWWRDRSSSLRVSRNIEAYSAKLKLILKQATHLMFIDPNIDPRKGNYRDFYKLLIAAKRSDIPPLIQIYRKNDSATDIKLWEKIFRESLADKLLQAGLKAEVFIWDEFHDRYLITNLIGINLPYGFDTTTKPNAKTTWCRLGEKDREEVQKEFDPNAYHHQLKHRFLIVE